MKSPLVFLSVAALLTLTGCVTGQRQIALDVPTAPVATAAPTKGAVYISAITDNRVFQNKPPEPWMPSIDGDVTTLTAAQKDRMIGRQRNGFGHAMGDIALPGDDTVTKRVRALVEEGLRRKGYSVSSDPAAPLSLAVSIDEFWAWMTPGFWALTFEVNISANLTLKGEAGSAQLAVKSHGLNHGQVAKNGNWKEAFDPAFEQFIDKLGTELDRANLHK